MGGWWAVSLLPFPFPFFLNFLLFATAVVLSLLKIKLNYLIINLKLIVKNLFLINIIKHQQA